MSKNTKMIIVAVIVAVLALVGLVWWFGGRGGDDVDLAPAPTPVPEPVNVIPVSDRPYTTLQPLVGRNDLELVFHNLKIEADEVEVTLEYDRNEGILDAILRTFLITEIPLVEKLFLGSKSAGGHITYHDDVIGGTILLEFDGDNPYALENAWRYDDLETEYEQLSTADGKFQVEFEEAFDTPKVVVMQSPGYPEGLEGTLIAGPYLFRGVGDLPEAEVKVLIRLAEENAQAKMFGFDGEEWIEIEAVVDGKNITATTEVYEVYVVMN